MATTTNYGWSTPDDTALVSQGAAAIRTLGSSVDTTVKALSPGTTAGDVDYYTSSTAKARLGIGTSGQVLSVSGGVPAWATVSASSLTLLSTTTLSGASTTISGISGSYQDLQVIVYGVNCSANGNLRIAPNGSTTITTMTRAQTGQTLDDYMYICGTGMRISVPDNTASITIYNYAGAFEKPFDFAGYGYQASNAQVATGGTGGIRTTSAITSLVVSIPSGTMSAGTVLIYGVK